MHFLFNFFSVVFLLTCNDIRSKTFSNYEIMDLTKENAHKNLKMHYLEIILKQISENVFFKRKLDTYIVALFFVYSC